MKRHRSRKEIKDKMIYNGDKEEKPLDSRNRMCQKRIDNNNRKDSKNRNGPMKWSHDRSPVII
jgi:hypothetical protein